MTFFSTHTPPFSYTCFKNILLYIGHTSQALGQADSEEEREIQDALKEITPAFDDKNCEESHLDLTLEEEASFVDEYRTLIATRSQLDER